MVHQFAQVPQADIQRSSFDRSCGHKTTFNEGKLIPIFVDEALPGDTFNLNATMFARMATPIFPVMDNMFLESFFFSVPARLVWDNWQRFQGEQINPGDSTDFTVPQIVAPAGGFAEGSIYDYMGLPTKVAGISINALYLRAYNLIYNQWFRDQNLINSITVPKTDGPDLDTLYTLQSRGKRLDYFTGCLPWPQKGPGVSIPLGTTAPVYGKSVNSINVNDGSANYGLGTNATGQVGLANYNTALGSAPVGGFPASKMIGLSPKGAESNVYADLSAATAATINSLRQAFAIQKIYERDARGGTRYVEALVARFKVKSPDARLQRPEYLGGSSTNINISPIPQTSATATQPSPTGTLAAMGTALQQGAGFTHSFTEHCLIIGIVQVRADLTYQKGIERLWSRKTRFDYFEPALGHLGEQAVLQKEIYASGNASDDTVFGYQERFAEYRYKPSLITGLFRSNAAAPLDAWHLSENFASAPVLGPTFIQSAPPVARVVAVPSQPHFLLDAFFSLRCARPMPLYGDPGYIDRF